MIGDGLPSVQDVSQLEVTRGAVEEGLRLYPPVSILFREPSEPVEFDGRLVQPDAIVTLPQFRFHRDERFCSTPERFDPARWREDTAADRPEHAYFPFGGGPRHCIGMRFARLELHLALAILVHRFEFERLSDAEPDLEPGMTLRPADSVKVRVRRP